MSDCNETSQNGNNEITMTKVSDPEKERAIRCLRMSFLFPMIITLTFCGVDMAVHFEKYCAVSQTDDILTWIVSIESLGIVLGYFSVTLITMALFMFIQQFYYKVYAGLDDNKAMTLLIIAVVYLIIYPVYIVTFFDSYVMTLFVLFLLVILGGYMWKSLSADVRSFSKHPSHKGGPNVFVSSIF